MMHHKHHKFAIGFTAIVIFVVGLVVGGYLAANVGLVDLESVKIGLMLTIIVLLLMTVSLILEVKRILHTLEPKKRRSK